jgi:hypothetical protein
MLSWQAGLVGSALCWLSRASDGERCNVALEPLALALTGPRVGSGRADAAAAAEMLLPLLQPLAAAGVSNAALLYADRLLSGGAGCTAQEAMRPALDALALLPRAARRRCAELVCDAVPALALGALCEDDGARLLSWLLVRAAGALYVAQRPRKRQQPAAGVPDRRE